MYTIDLSDDEERIISSIRKLHGYRSKSDVIHFALKQLLLAELQSNRGLGTINLGHSSPPQGFVGKES